MLVVMGVVCISFLRGFPSTQWVLCLSVQPRETSLARGCPPRVYRSSGAKTYCALSLLLSLREVAELSDIDHTEPMRRTLLAVCIAAVCLAPGRGGADETESPAPSTIEGSWMLAIPMPEGIEKPTLRVRQRASKDGFKATLKGRQGSARLKNFSFQGSSFSFEQNVPAPGGDLTLKFRGSVRGDRVQGVIELPMGILPFTGERNPR